MVTVRYTGPRYMPMVYDVYVNGLRYNGQGYRFGSHPRYQTAVMTQEEADILTGATETLITDDGTPVNAAVARGELTEEQQAAETWEAAEV